MQGQLLAADPLLRAGLVDEHRGVLLVLGDLDRPGHDLAAPHVHDEVGVQERSPDGPAHVGDVPAPHLVRARRPLLPRLAMRPGPRTLAVGQLPLFVEQPVDGRLRSQELATVGEMGDDLTRRQVSELGSVDDAQDLRALLLAAEPVNDFETLCGSIY